jgi:hypothetical protein
MKRYLSYFKAVVRHKWFVYTAWRDIHREFRVSLFWIILHDWDKFLPGEFIPYARSFFNQDGSARDIRKADYYDAARVGKAFDKAWLMHQKRNKHHWQWWVLPLDDGGIKPLRMSSRHVNEMLMDWIGAGRSYGGKTQVWEWYEAHKDKMVLDAGTRIEVTYKLIKIKALLMARSQNGSEGEKGQS